MKKKTPQERVSSKTTRIPRPETPQKQTRSTWTAVPHRNSRTFRKTSGEEQTGVAFNQTQQKDSKYKKKMNSKGKYHYFHCRRQYHWAADCPNIEDEN